MTTIRIAEMPCGASSAFLHPGCADRWPGVEIHERTAAELVAQQIVWCDGCGKSLLPAHVRLCPCCNAILNRLTGPDGWPVEPCVSSHGGKVQERRRLAAVYACPKCDHVEEGSDQ